jgi:hypothetical protein
MSSVWFKALFQTPNGVTEAFFACWSVAGAREAATNLAALKGWTVLGVDRS